MTDTTNPTAADRAREIVARLRDLAPVYDKAIEATCSGAADLLDELAAETEALRRELDRCGKENCIGRKVKGLRRWVNEEQLIAANARALAAEQRIKVLEAALGRVRKVIEQGYPGVAKTEKCEHDRFGFEDCMACYDEALLEALSAGVSEEVGDG